MYAVSLFWAGLLPNIYSGRKFTKNMHWYHNFAPNLCRNLKFGISIPWDKGYPKHMWMALGWPWNDLDLEKTSKFQHICPWVPSWLAFIKKSNIEGLFLFAMFAPSIRHFDKKPRLSVLFCWFMILHMTVTHKNTCLPI